MVVLAVSYTHLDVYKRQGVSVQGYTDVCVTHDILQGFRIHPRFCHIRAKGVPAYMLSLIHI